MNPSKQAGSREKSSLTGDSGEHLQTSIDSKSVREMSEYSGPKKAIGKADARYWLQKGKLVSDSRSRFLSCKIQVNGRRESFPLRSSNKANAAAKAAQIFGDVVALGWTDALLKHKPDESKPSGIATIGQYLGALYATVTFRKSTGRAYEQALRTIAAGIAGIGDQPAMDEKGEVQKDKKGRIITVSRRDHNHGGHLAWRNKVDAVSLSLLTAEKNSEVENGISCGSGGFSSETAKGETHSQLNDSFGSEPFLKQERPIEACSLPIDDARTLAFCGGGSGRRGNDAVCLEGGWS